MEIVRGHIQIGEQVRGIFHVQCNKMRDGALVFEFAVNNHQS